MARNTSKFGVNPDNCEAKAEWLATVMAKRGMNLTHLQEATGLSQGTANDKRRGFDSKGRPAHFDDQQIEQILNYADKINPITDEEMWDIDLELEHIRGDWEERTMYARTPGEFLKILMVAREMGTRDLIRAVGCNDVLIYFLTNDRSKPGKENMQKVKEAMGMDRRLADRFDRLVEACYRNYEGKVVPQFQQAVELPLPSVKASDVRREELPQVASADVGKTTIV